MNNIENCCVCEGEQDIITKKYSLCFEQHSICKSCFLLILQICYCKNSVGEFVYKCPMCRTENRISNKEMNRLLIGLTGSNILCIKIHTVCERQNKIKKCRVEKCGCRTNIVNVVSQNDDILTFEYISKIANKYPENCGLNEG